MSRPSAPKESLRRYGAVVDGASPEPVSRFENSGFPPSIVQLLEGSGFAEPTPVQAVGWPLVLSGHDVLGLAQTGGGKTLAYLLPGLVHAAEKETGLSGLVLAPTRELVLQIHGDCLRFGEALGVRSNAVYGGVPRRAQVQSLQRGAGFCVATPGRLLDLVEAGAVSVGSVSYLVLDEADRMLDMGFEPQLRRLISQIGPARQTVLWSATWPKELERMVKDVCREGLVRLTIGRAAPNESTRQEVHVLSKIEKRSRFFEWLREACPAAASPQPRILIFTETKRCADALCQALRNEQFAAASIHSGKEQPARDKVMRQFRAGLRNILVATDVAQRGLDVQGVQYVVNYDLPKTLEDYVHRIGRTGRSGERGHAVTFFAMDRATPDLLRMARAISGAMRDAGQEPPSELRRLAEL